MIVRRLIKESDATNSLASGMIRDLFPHMSMVLLIIFIHSFPFNLPESPPKGVLTSFNGQSISSIMSHAFCGS